MKPFKIYKHEKNTDVAFMPKRVERVFDDETHLVGWWINIVNPDNIFVLGKDRFTVAEKDLPHWKQIHV